MKNILWFMLLVPLATWAQFKTINFNAQGFPLKINRETISQDLTTLLGISNDFSFEIQLEKTITDKIGGQHFTYQQFYQGYQVENAVIKLHYKEGKLYHINGEYLLSIPSNGLTKIIPESIAFDIAKQKTGAEQYIWDSPESLKRLPKNNSTKLLFPVPHGQLVIYTPNARRDSIVVLAYKFDIYATKPLSRNYVYVNAYTGDLMGKRERMHSVDGTGDTRYSGERIISADAENGSFRLRDYDSNRGDGIETYNMQTGTDIGAAVDFIDNDNDWTAAEHDNVDMDNAALDAHWGATMTYDYFFDVHGRSSIDGNGAVLQNYVHYSVGWENARWTGTAMQYGDGGANFSILTALDVIAHEIGHGLDENTSDLVYQDESGAVDEGLADIWGACVEQFATTNKQTWLIGEDIDIRTGHIALRSMSNPNAEGQPDTYEGTNWCDYTDDNLECTSGDYGGVHTNSGVMNFWFFLLTEGGTGTNDLSNPFNVAAIGINDAAAIVFRAETVYMTANTTFADARTFTIQAAQDLFGNCSPQVISTVNAWFAVGIGNSYQTIGDIEITTDYFSPHTEDFYAPNLLQASNTVGSGTNIRYESSGSIELLPGFEAESGSNFIAEIVPCVDLSSAKTEATAELRLTGSTTTQKPTEPQQFKIFPNPADESFNILFLSDNFQKAEIKITDANNRLVKSFHVLSKLSEVKVNDLAAGTYFINITLDGNLLISKVVKN